MWLMLLPFCFCSPVGVEIKTLGNNGVSRSGHVSPGELWLVGEESCGKRVGSCISWS